MATFRTEEIDGELKQNAETSTKDLLANQRNRMIYRGDRLKSYRAVDLMARSTHVGFKRERKLTDVEDLMRSISIRSTSSNNDYRISSPQNQGIVNVISQKSQSMGKPILSKKSVRFSIFLYLLRLGYIQKLNYWAIEPGQ